MGQLRDRMEQDLILKGLSAATRRNYLLYCRTFVAHYGRSPEDELVGAQFLERPGDGDVACARRRPAVW